MSIDIARVYGHSVVARRDINEAKCECGWRGTWKDKASMESWISNHLRTGTTAGRMAVSPLFADIAGKLDDELVEFAAILGGDDK